MTLKITKQQLKTILIIFIALIAMATVTTAAILHNSNQQNQKFELDDKAEMGITSLNVKDINKIKKFYDEVVGLHVLEENDNETILGLADNKILRLVSTPNLEIPNVREAGLYHNAFLFKNKATLAKSLKNILEISPNSYEGSSDHLVSNAFYFTDPERNGLELYWDRPKDEWPVVNGQIQMGSHYIDINEFISQNINGTDEATARMGHIHLQVGDIPKAKDFYVNVLGFDVISEMPNALFVSVGGYHHHIGMNTWQSNGAGVRSETLGLREFEMKLSSKNELNRLEDQLNKHGVEYKREGNELGVKDPWRNTIVFSVSK